MVLRKDKPLSRPLSMVCQSIQEHCAQWMKQPEVWLAQAPPQWSTVLAANALPSADLRCRACIDTVDSVESHDPCAAQLLGSHMRALRFSNTWRVMGLTTWLRI
jgi:hypothetical protein